MIICGEGERVVIFDAVASTPSNKNLHPTNEPVVLTCTTSRFLPFSNKSANSLPFSQRFWSALTPVKVICASTFDIVSQRQRPLKDSYFQPLVYTVSSQDITFTSGFEKISQMPQDYCLCLTQAYFVVAVRRSMC
jgi:hypothetical protein